jgi:hypothetical protein
VPGATSLPFALGSKLVRDEWGEARFPLAHRFVGELKATLQEHLGEIAQAQFVPYSPEDNQEDEIGGELKKVVGSASALIELAPTGGTAKGAIAKLGSLSSCALLNPLWV